jgi:hypothetical protein
MLLKFYSYFGLFCLSSSDAIAPVGDDETPGTLWGEDKPDPIEAFKENGFSMRKVHLTRPPIRPRRGGGAKAAE